MPPLLSLLLLLLVTGVVASAAIVWVMARALIRPPRMTDAKALYVLKRLTPSDVGLAFEDVSFTVRDERTGETLKLASWWIPHPHAAGRTAVLIHGYADAKVGAIAWAPTWHALGLNLLVLDLRAHGQSGGDTCTAGYFERHDLPAVVGQIRADRPADARQIVLVGISLGASTVLGAAVLGEGIADAVVLDSPIADFRTAALAHFDLLGLPGRPFQRAAIHLAERLSGADFAAIAPLKLMAEVRCPLLVIAPSDDAFVTPAEKMKLEQAVTVQGEFWRVEGARHLEALYTDPETYRAKIATFLARALSPTTETYPRSMSLPASAG